jgi:hypothetical protein
VPSALVVATMVPSGLNATALTWPVWAARVAMGWRVWAHGEGGGDLVHPAADRPRRVAAVDPSTVGCGVRSRIDTGNGNGGPGRPLRRFIPPGWAMDDRTGFDYCALLGVAARGPRGGHRGLP